MECAVHWAVRRVEGRDIATALVADIEVLVGQLRWIGWGVAEGAKW